MAVPATVDRIATILEGIADVTEVYAGRPNDIPPAQTPAFVIFTGEATAETDSERGMDDTYFIVRAYRLILLVSTWVENIELESEALCRPYFALVEDAFINRPMLELTPGSDPLTSVVRCVYTGDSGVININLANKAYAGVEFGIQVTEVRHRTYS